MKLRAVLLFCTVLLLSAVFCFASDDVYVGARKPASVSPDRIDHAVFDSLLRKYVRSDGMVNYRAWHTTPSDVQMLDQYLVTLSAADPAQGSADGRLALWINAYNAVTVRGILREYPTSSIRNHTPKLFGYNIWKNLKLYVGGLAYSLEDIEHKVLRRMNEPRIHFAVVCASVGCPRLLNEAYTPQRVREQLEANAEDFFSRRQNFRHDTGQRRFYLSQILSWYGTDFGSDRSRQLKAIAKWLPTEEARQAALKNAVSVSYISYDWRLNEQ